MIALFGWGRHTDRLNADYKPLTFGEIDAESQRLADYVRNFDAGRPDVVRLGYLDRSRGMMCPASKLSTNGTFAMMAKRMGTMSFTT